MARAKVITKTYPEIRGVDFSREARNVRENRSPDMLNMWKDYEEDSECIITREGIDLLADFSNTLGIVGENKEIYGIHIFTNDDTVKALVHMGKNLILWEDFPSEYQNDTSPLFVSMNEYKSSSFMYNDKLYINDGLNYLRYDGSELIDICDKERINNLINAIDENTIPSSINNLDVPFIPTTTISRVPTGGGETYQGVNVLNDFRINQFNADGKNKVYFLDTTDLGSEYTVKVWINDVFLKEEGSEVTYDYIDESTGKISTATKTFKVESVDYKKGSITFNDIPPKPATIGTDNVVILFYKNVEEYQDRISGCSINVIFDNRVFFSGNKKYKNALFHSELNEPEYISDLNYYQDGSDEEPISSLFVGGSVLWVFKESKEGEDNLFYHVPQNQTITTTNFAGNTETKTTKTYISKHGKSSVKVTGSSINFLDDVCFLSKEGMYGLSYSDLDDDIYSMDFICSRSRLVNPKLINDEIQKASMAIYKGYLCILINSIMYLADSRATYKSNKGYEYEWFYFDNIKFNENDGVYLKNYDDKLYFATTGGQVCVFNGNTKMDIDKPVRNYITLKADNFDNINHLKTTSKRGGIVKLKPINGSAVSVYAKTNKQRDFPDRVITVFSNVGFSFNNINFSKFTFLTGSNNYRVVKTKQKKFNEVQFRFEGKDEKGESAPFGFYSFIIEAFYGSYIKR